MGSNEARGAYRWLSCYAPPPRWSPSHYLTTGYVSGNEEIEGVENLPNAIAVIRTSC
jgi:hypothetical protein